MILCSSDFVTLLIVDDEDNCQCFYLKNSTILSYTVLLPNANSLLVVSVLVEV